MGDREAWPSLEFLEQRFVVGDDAIVVLNRGRLTARGTGRVLETSLGGCDGDAEDTWGAVGSGA